MHYHYHDFIKIKRKFRDTIFPLLLVWTLLVWSCTQHTREGVGQGRCQPTQIWKQRGERMKEGDKLGEMGQNRWKEEKIEVKIVKNSSIYTPAPLDHPTSILNTPLYTPLSGVLWANTLHYFNYNTALTADPLYVIGRGGFRGGATSPPLKFLFFRLCSFL